MESTFGKTLKRIRSDQGLSLSETARRIGVSKSTYHDWEEGRRVLGEPYVKIAEALNTSINELFQIRVTPQEEVLDELRVLINQVEKISKLIMKQDFSKNNNEFPSN